MATSTNSYHTPNRKSEISFSLAKFAISSWGVLGVVTFLANALQRLIPVALQPLVNGDLSSGQMAIYILWILYMAYVEGYKAFHLKFSPFVVRRSLTLAENPTFLKCLFAGPYCMGLFGATKKRMIISWSLLAGVFALVKVVKMLPYPWRSIVDAGVVCGLSLGTLSMIYYYLLSLFGRVPPVEADLPEDHNRVD